MPLQEFLTLFIFCTFAFKKKCMRSLHAYTPVSGSFTSEPLDQSVKSTSTEGREGGYQIPVPSLNLAQIPVPRLIFAKIPVTKSKIPLHMIICKIMRIIN